MTLSDIFWIIAVVLGIGMCYKLPAVLRGGRNPLARQVGGLLLAACAVFTFAAPATIAAVNDLTGIPNFSAPWVYSLLTGFCASCLLLIIKWRGGSPQSIRRATWWVYGSYGALIAALWICFALGDHSVERLRDLDTYYANTPWMREMIVLYLLGHTVAVLITSALLWTWESRVRGTGLLHAGVVLLGIGYAMNLLYDIAKLTPVIARWNGRTDLDWMSTDLAPPIAGLVGVLIALGFIVPHAGERMSHRFAARREYRALGPLAHALHRVPTASAPVALPRFAPLELRLTRRKTVLRDAVRQLQPYIDPAERDQAAQFHRNQGRTPDEAHALAEATALTAAVERLLANSDQSPDQPSRPTTESLSGDLVAISRALRRLPGARAGRWTTSDRRESVTP
ncbi:MAB_1171c family putative transporter [Streptomyces pharetrae]|uniref:MAB_1171c family putative transporter n=1 Tax=Streptomyces pharetrae TaxID=291370 RepID=UPI00335AE563